MTDSVPDRVDGPDDREVDPFDLPEWVGAGATWSTEGSVHAGAQVPGRLAQGSDSLRCDLLAVDEAYPNPVIAEKWRARAHRAWKHGQILLLHRDGVLTMAAPGSVFTADLVVEIVSRFAKAVGAAPERFVVAVRP